MAGPSPRRAPRSKADESSATNDLDGTAAFQPVNPTPPGPTGFGPPVEPGEVGRLGPYRVVKELGKGGMGAVYAAVDTRLERRIALKVMLPRFAADPAAKARFLREARSAATVTHDNVVTVYEADERDGVPYIAMQFLEGYPLDEYLRKKGGLTIPEVVRVAAETAAGLAAAHATGMVHRDIKPGNLWLEAPVGRVKVLDFGLAKPVDAEVELTKNGTVVGTPAYMSPEQARGEKVDHRTDLFSLGTVLYRLCTGRLPFEGSTTMAVLMALGTEEPKPVREQNPAVPEPLAELIHQLLAKKADARPADAAEVVARLRAIGRGSSVSQASPAMLSQPTFVPIQVTAFPDANPFADIDADVTDHEPVTAPAGESKPTRPTGGSSLWAFAGIAAVLAACVVGGVVVFKNKGGTEAKRDVPDAATGAVKVKDGKADTPAGPGGKPPVVPADPDRVAAEYALAIGGTVWVNGFEEDIKAVADLPKRRFTLTGLNLFYNAAVTDAKLAVFRNCKGLTHLHLGYSAVTEAGLVHFQDCKGLKYLDLNRLGVTDDGLAHFKDCKGLTYLSLAYSKVSEEGLAHFKDCKGLTTLYLFSSRVTGDGLAPLKDCKALKDLNLMSVATDAGLTHLKDCKELTSLDVSHSNVTDAGLAQLKDCKKLTTLNLGRTTVTDAGLAHFQDCELAQLYLERTNVTDAGLAHFKGCKGLTRLGLNDTAVTDAGLAHIPCGELEYLDLGRAKVTDAGLAHFKGCKKLTALNLSETKVTDAGLAHFKGCKGLTSLNVKTTQVTPKGLELFQKDMPQCKITHDDVPMPPN